MLNHSLTVRGAPLFGSSDFIGASDSSTGRSEKPKPRRIDRRTQPSNKYGSSTRKIERSCKLPAVEKVADKSLLTVNIWNPIDITCVEDVAAIVIRWTIFRSKVTRILGDRVVCRGVAQSMLPGPTPPLLRDT